MLMKLGFSFVIPHKICDIVNSNLLPKISLCIMWRSWSPVRQSHCNPSTWHKKQWLVDQCIL